MNESRAAWSKTVATTAEAAPGALARLEHQRKERPTRLSGCPAESSVAYDQVKANGPESLPDLAPMAIYMTLAPFVGVEEAYERAMEESEKW